jgi:hypothetical protein
VKANASAESLGNLSLALAALEAAREQLQTYALATDAPLVGVVDAADHMDRASACLADSLMGADHAAD